MSESFFNFPIFCLFFIVLLFQYPIKMIALILSFVFVPIEIYSTIFFFDIYMILYNFFEYYNHINNYNYLYLYDYAHNIYLLILLVLNYIFIYAFLVICWKICFELFMFLTDIIFSFFYLLDIMGEI
jgi:hypothetical protein